MPDESALKVRKVEGAFSCICGVLFKHRSSLMVHLKSHTEEKNFICEYCSRAFRQKANLDLHIKGHSKERPFVCQTCDKEYISKRALLTHRRVHTKEKSYKCNFCQKTFSHHDNLKRHIARHSGIKAFACGICSRCFSDQLLLTSHLKVHSSDKHFECDTCGKKFARRQMLQCHLVIHTGQKPYKCNECQKRFAHNSDALKHQKIHSGIRPFACQLCSSTFVRRAHLTRHGKTHNKIHKHKTTNELLNSDNNNYNHKRCNAELKNDYGFNKSSYAQINCKEFKQRSNETPLMKNGPYIPNVKFDNSGIVDIQFICTSLKDDLVVGGECAEECVEIKSKEELDSVVNSLGKEGHVKVLIGRENKEGDWEYEEVETTIERTADEPDSTIYKGDIQVEMQNKNDGELFKSNLTDAPTPWKCALCNIHFVNKSDLTGHVKYNHIDFTMFKKYAVKLVKNKASGEIVKNPLALKQKIHPLSKDVLQPVFTKYLIKDRTLKEALPIKQTKLLFNNNFKIFDRRKPLNVSFKNNNIEDSDKTENNCNFKSDKKYNIVSQNDYNKIDYCSTESENCNTALENCSTESENCDTALENCSTESENCNTALENCSTESENCNTSLEYCSTESENCNSALENCNIESDNCNFDSKNLNIFSLNCNDKSEDCFNKSANCKIGHDRITKNGSIQDLDIILNENNYESLQEKKIIREIGNDDSCFAIIIVDK